MSQNEFTLVIDRALRYLDASVGLAEHIYRSPTLNDRDLEEAVNLAVKAMTCDELSLFLFDPEQRSLKLVASSVGDEVYKAPDNTDKHEIPLYNNDGSPTPGITAWVGRHPMILSLQDCRKIPAEVRDKYPQDRVQLSGNDFFVNEELELCQVLLVPLVVEKRIIGFLRAHSPMSEKLTSDGEHFLRYVASLLGPAIGKVQRNLRLIDHMGTINATIEKIMSVYLEHDEVNLRTFLDTVSETIGRTFGSRIVSIYLAEKVPQDSSWRLCLQGAYNIPPPYEDFVYDEDRRGTTWYIFDTGNIVISANVEEEKRHHVGRYREHYYGNIEEYNPGDPVPFMGLPLQAGDRKLGVIKVEFPLSRRLGKMELRLFDEMDSSLFKGISTLVSFAIEAIRRIGDLEEERSHFRLLERGMNEEPWEMEEWKRQIVLSALQRCQDNKAEAAKLLGISPRTVYKYASTTL